MKATKKQMERVLVRYGREIIRGERIRKRNGGLNTLTQVMRYCRALEAVWKLAEQMARAR